MFGCLSSLQEPLGGEKNIRPRSPYLYPHIIQISTWAVFKKFLLISWPRIQSLRRSLRSLTFSKILLTAQQFQRTSLRISYGKHRQTKELSVSGKHMPGRCKIFTRSEQVPQVRLAKCCCHWLLNCRSLTRFRWHWRISVCATWQQPC